MNASETESKRLAALHRAHLLETPPEPAFDRLTSLAARIFQVPIAYIALLDERRMWVKSTNGPVVRELERPKTFCNHVVVGGEMIVVRDATKDDRFRELCVVTQKDGIRFYAGVPLLSAEGYAIGTFCLLDIVPRDFSTEKLDVLKELAAIAGDEIEHRSNGAGPAEPAGRREETANDLEVLTR